MTHTARTTSARRHLTALTLGLSLCIGAGCGADETSPKLYVGENNVQDQRDPGAVQGTNNTYAGAPQNNTTSAPDYQAGETFEDIPENDFVDAATENTSTFSIDVDTASYTIMRRDIRNGALPRPESVRPEEFINYFDYGYPEPTTHPFSIHLEAAPSKFGEGKHLVQIGIKGREVTAETMKPTNLVFLIDVSGSMQSERKLPLVKKSLQTLLDHLRPTDTVGIVVYAGADRVALESTPVADKQKILAALDNLRAGGSTNAEAGIVKAYQMAEAAKKEGGNNRVIILTDGDFNVGKTGDALFTLIDTYREKHISLTCMGYGLGNYHDQHMETISNRGNGNYFYVDSEDEAARVFGAELTSTLEVIAADVKIQVEFDTEAVSKYRLVGYDNRVLNNEDFRDDTKDAGEIGPGHTVTAYYEVELKEDAADTAVLSEVRIRYKSQYGESSQETSRFIKIANVKERFEDASAGFRWGASVAEYAEVLRKSKHVDSPDLASVEAAASAASSGTAKQAELLDLVKLAQPLWSAQTP